MFLAKFATLFFATILIVSLSAIPAPSLDEMDDSGLEEIFQPTNKYASWLYKRNSPLCDYRLQFRPLPLTSALCGYGHHSKDDGTMQTNPFKYG